MSLRGRRVVVTRARAQAPALGSLLEDAGAEAIYLPTIDVHDPEDWAPLDAALQRLVEGEYEWMLLASRNAAERVVARLQAAGPDLSNALRAKVGAVGGKTRSALEEAGIAVDLVPERFTGRALAESLGQGRGKVLFPRVAGGPREIISALEAGGWVVDEVPAYVNALPDTRRSEFERVRGGGYDVLTFLSPSAATNFVKMLGDPKELDLHPGARSGRLVACIGPQTEARLRELGFRVDVVPAEHTAQALVAALAAAPA